MCLLAKCLQGKRSQTKLSRYAWNLRWKTGREILRKTGKSLEKKSDVKNQTFALESVAGNQLENINISD